MMSRMIRRASSALDAKCTWPPRLRTLRSEEHTSELQSHVKLVCRLLLEKKKTAPVSVRERLATVPSELEGRLRRLLDLPAVREAAIVSTCNPMEIYGACHYRKAAHDACR